MVNRGSHVAIDEQWGRKQGKREGKSQVGRGGLCSASCVEGGASTNVWKDKTKKKETKVLEGLLWLNKDL